jgi:hypothetical protein
MLRIALTLMALSTMPATATAGPHYPGTITGDLLLRSYMGPSERRDDPFLKAGDIVDRQLARGFMDGIKDATEGTAWCYVSGKPHELNDDIAAALSKLPPETLKGRAAPLVVAALRERFPCRNGSLRRKP